MYDITAIKKYILFLKRECGLFITLHPMENESLILSSDLITFNIHDNPYCIYVKSFSDAQKHCIECQRKVFEKCQKGPFCGVCHAGVKEYVYPITDGQKYVGFISVSGYRSEHADSYMDALAKKYFITRERLSEVVLDLNPNIPSKEKINTLLMPLCSMLELAYIRSEDDGKSEEHLIDSVIRYIKKYHTQNITLEDICKSFTCSRSYISHMFKRHTGRTFREYLTDIRVEDAKSLLCYSKLSATEIAFSVGFGDSTYFSKVFKRYVGVSPAAYRKSTK